MYVVNGSDSARFKETQDALHEIYQDPRLSGKPLLMYVSSKDTITNSIRLSNQMENQPSANPDQLFEALNLKSLFPDSNAYSHEYHTKAPFRIQECNSKYMENSNAPIDERIKTGFRWLLETIQVHQKELDTRVYADQAQEELKRIGKNAAGNEQREAIKSSVL